MARELRRRVFLPAWLPIVCWPLLAVIALGGGYLGGGAAVACAIVAVATGVALTWAASWLPDATGPDDPGRSASKGA